MQLSSRHCGVCKYLKAISHDPHQSPGILTTPWGDSAPRRGWQLWEGRGVKAPSQGTHAQTTSLGWASLRRGLCFSPLFPRMNTLHWLILIKEDRRAKEQIIIKAGHLSSACNAKKQEWTQWSTVSRRNITREQANWKAKNPWVQTPVLFSFCQSYFGVCHVQGGRQPGGCSPFDD